MRILVSVALYLAMHGAAVACIGPSQTMEFAQRESAHQLTMLGLAVACAVLARWVSRGFWLPAMAILPLTNWVLLPYVLCTTDMTRLNAGIQAATLAAVVLIAGTAGVVWVVRRLR